MKTIIVLGLCNPGKEYDTTWHNIGSACLDALLEQNNLSMNKNGKYAFYETTINDCNIVLAYSRSVYMNDSGIILLNLKQRYNFDSENLIVLHDEVMLPLGQIKCSFGGSAKGHNGLRNIIEKIGSNFYRIKIGVGHPGKGSDLGKYLTQKTKPVLFQTCINKFIEEISLEKLKAIGCLKPNQIS